MARKYVRPDNYNDMVNQTGEKKTPVWHSTKPVHPLMDAIRKERVAQGMSIAMAATIAGSNANIWAKRERGYHIPNFITLVDMANTVGLEVSLMKKEDKKE
jgi:hypothetical protein